MKYKIYKREDYKRKDYEGYTVDEVSTCSADLDASFICQSNKINLSGENIQLSKTFSYKTILVPLEEEVFLVKNGNESTKVMPLRKYEIEKETDVKAFGRGNIYALQLHHEAEEDLKVYSLSRNAKVLDVEGKKLMIFYCVGDYLAISVEGETLMLRKGEEATFNVESTKIIGIMGAGEAIVSQVSFNEEAHIPKERAGVEDFFMSLKLSAMSIRGSKRFFKEAQNEWFDEELQKGINRIERSFITLVMCLLGIGVISFSLIEFNKINLILPVVVIWLMLDIFVISPLIYMAILPKPIRAHIKKIEDLTPDEMKIHEERKKENHKADRILKKYKISGRNKYKE